MTYTEFFLFLVASGLVSLAIWHWTPAAVGRGIGLYKMYKRGGVAGLGKTIRFHIWNLRRTQEED